MFPGKIFENYLLCILSLGGQEASHQPNFHDILRAYTSIIPKVANSSSEKRLPNSLVNGSEQRRKKIALQVSQASTQRRFDAIAYLNAPPLIF